MSLDDCMHYAVENSPAVKRQELTNDNYRQNRNESLASFFPTVDAGVSGQASFGRVAGADNIAVDNTTQYRNSYSLSSRMPLFAGLSNINMYRAARVAVEQGKQELELARDQTALAVMQAYFDVVYFTRAAELAAEKLEATQINLRTTAKQEELGIKSRADLLELEAQAASDEYLLTQQQNKRDMALITLKEKMNYPSVKELRIDVEPTINEGESPVVTPRTVAGAVGLHPKMKAAELSMRQAELSFKATRGTLLPSLSLSGGFSNGYYHTQGTDNYSFRKQWELNQMLYVGVNLSIPIFSNLSRRTAANRARNNMMIAQQNRVEVEQSLISEVEQDYRQLENLERECVQASKKVSTARLAHKAVTRQYEQQVASALELQTSANRLLEAQAELLNARLQYIVKRRLVEYYNGEPLIRQ